MFKPSEDAVANWVLLHVELGDKQHGDQAQVQYSLYQEESQVLHVVLLQSSNSIKEFFRIVEVVFGDLR